MHDPKFIVRALPLRHQAQTMPAAFGLVNYTYSFTIDNAADWGSYRKIVSK